MRGVPIARIVEGIKTGISISCEIIEQKSQSVEGVDDPILEKIALSAGRDHNDIAQLVVKAAQLVGEKKIKDDNFKLMNTIVAQAGAENEVFMGVLINRSRVNKEMPKELDDVKILIVDDALEPEELGEEALTTEKGFTKYLELQEEFKSNLNKIVDLGVKLVLVDKNITRDVEELFIDAGIMLIDRVPSKDLHRVAEHVEQE